MKLEAFIGLPWIIVGTISALISGAIAYGSYQLGLYFAATYSSAWILPILFNIFAFINGLYVLVALGYVLVGIVMGLIGLFAK